MIIDPRGEVVARASRGEETVLTYEVDYSLIRSAKAANDVAGHNWRPDVFDLKVLGISVTQLEPLGSNDELEKWQDWANCGHFTRFSNFI